MFALHPELQEPHPKLGGARTLDATPRAPHPLSPLSNVTRARFFPSLPPRPHRPFGTASSTTIHATALASSAAAPHVKLYQVLGWS